MRERLAPLQTSFEEEGQPSKEIWKEMGNQVNIKILVNIENVTKCVFRECWECLFLLRLEELEHLF